MAVHALLLMELCLMSELSRAFKLSNRRQTGVVLAVAGRQCQLSVGGLVTTASLAAGVRPSVGDTVAISDIDGSLLVETVTQSEKRTVIERKRLVSSGEQDVLRGSSIFVATINVTASSLYTLQHNLGTYPKTVTLWHIDGSGEYALVRNEAAVAVSDTNIKIKTGSYTVNNALRSSTSGSYLIIAE